MMNFRRMKQVMHFIQGARIIKIIAVITTVDIITILADPGKGKIHLLPQIGEQTPIIDKHAVGAIPGQGQEYKQNVGIARGFAC